MKIKAYCLFVILATSVLTACTTTQPTMTGQNTNTQPSVMIKNGVGVLPQSTYFGVLPCADCSGIKTNLVINHDGTFVMEQEYLGKADKFITKGSYDIGGVDNRYVLLHPEGQADPMPYLIYIDGNRVEFRDLADGEKPNPNQTLNLVS
ncbi:outer membrane protein G1a OmpG1a [Moraxella macacae 0408225]|uniref:Outer membrane protein G1a OmpG1a n=1 Tax=Moraxella macacae 0408225 TaxID=1230338 RepID=L2F7R9_9GAMM|nr:copper resistance protein NlpE [Moraxella macacae]ELA09062.1 outer membrane protein G1a OmpG1a [Moraxella macacae 0408225]